MKARKINISVVAAFSLASAISVCFAQTKHFTLEECREAAILNSNESKNAELDIKAARAQKKEVITNFFPTIVASGTAMHAIDDLIKLDVKDIFGNNDFSYNLQQIWTDIAPEFGLDPTFRFVKYGQMYNATALQPVFAGGRIVNGTRYADLGIKAAVVKKQLTEREVLETVDKNYYGVIALVEKQKTLDALQVLLDSLDKIANVAVKEGVIIKADNMLLQTKKMELANGKLQLKGGLRLMKMNLLNTIGYKYNVRELDSFKFDGSAEENIPTPEQVYKDEYQVVSCLEETQLLDMQIKAKQFEKKLAMGEALPQIGIGFTYGTSRVLETQPFRSNGIVFATVIVPITDWAKTSFKMERKQAEVSKAMNDKEHLSEMLVLQQRKFYLELTTAWDALTLAKSQKEYNLYLYDQAKVSYDAGYTTVTDMLQAYCTLADSEENYANCLNDYITALQIYTGRIRN